MRVLNLAGLTLQCDADQVTRGDALAQARQAVDLINLTLQREPYGLAAQLMIDEERLLAEFEQSNCFEDDEDAASAVEGGLAAA